jgi:hypothetical protein
MAAEMVTARARSNETLVSLSRLVVIVVERRLKMPVKSRLEQVHLARRFGASNLVKTPFLGRLTEEHPWRVSCDQREAARQL